MRSARLSGRADTVRLLGITEARAKRAYGRSSRLQAAIFPGVSYMLTRYYKRSEITVRVVRGQSRPLR